jgi:hypothetical protein
VCIQVLDFGRVSVNPRWYLPNENLLRSLIMSSLIQCRVCVQVLDFGRVSVDSVVAKNFAVGNFLHHCVLVALGKLDPELRQSGPASQVGNGHHDPLHHDHHFRSIGGSGLLCPDQRYCSHACVIRLHHHLTSFVTHGVTTIVVITNTRHTHGAECASDPPLP